MANLDLRPLSLGEILDRTFSLYRRNFLLFLGITALPELLILAFNLVRTMTMAMPILAPSPIIGQSRPPITSGILAYGFSGLFVMGIIYMTAYLFAQGGAVYAVSELYLGRSTTIGASLGRVPGRLLSLFGMIILYFLAILGATILFIFPGIYVACRFMICLPAALNENLGPFGSLGRSFRLTKGSAGRAFVIYLLFIVLLYAAMTILMLPFAIGAGLSAKDPNMMRTWLALAQVGSFFAGVLVGPFFTIATAIFYYDLRVRKEAFDLQLMMQPAGQIPSGAAGAPPMLS